MKFAACVLKMRRIFLKYELLSVKDLMRHVLTFPPSGREL